MIEAQQLSFHYPRQQQATVQQLNLQLQSQQVLGFLGVNGAGKSTSLRLLVGLLKPRMGSVQIAGIDIHKNPQQAKAHLGYLADIPPVYKTMRVCEYLSFCAKLHRISAKSQQTAINKVVDLCDLSSVYQRIIGQLSTGFIQRLGIAQAIIHQPAVVILDEPTTGLDPLQQQHIHQLIKDLGQQCSVLFSSHILSEVADVCDRVHVLHQGKTLFQGDLTELQQQRQQQVLTVGLRAPPNPAELLAIAGVLAVSATDNLWTITYASNHCPAEKIVSIAVANGWGLYEIHQQQDSLLQVFTGLFEG